MRRPHVVPEGLRGAPFNRATGLRHVSAGQLRGPRYRRLAPDAYWPVDAEVTHGRMIQAWRCSLPPDAVLGGLSAAWAHGVELAHVDDPVEVCFTAARRVRGRPGLRVRAVPVRGRSCCPTEYGPTMTLGRTIVDLGRRSPLTTAVARVDALLRIGGYSAQGLQIAVAGLAGGRGMRQLREVARLADPRAESPPESMLRLHLVLAGLPPPVPQHEVRDADGRFVARVDLAWPELKVAVEYDGRYHDDPAQFARDRRRLNALRRAGWQVISIDAAQLRDVQQVIALIRTVLSAAR